MVSVIHSSLFYMEFLGSVSILGKATLLALFQRTYLEPNQTFMMRLSCFFALRFCLLHHKYLRGSTPLRHRHYKLVLVITSLEG